MNNHGRRRQRAKVGLDRRSKWPSLSSIHVLAPAGEDRLVVRASNIVRGFSIAFLVFGSLILLGWIEVDAFADSEARALRLLAGGFLLLFGAGLSLAPGRTVLDRREAYLSKGNWLFRFSCPIQEIVAVQLIYGKPYGPRPSLSYRSRQLDLVLSHPDIRRLHLTNHSGDEAGARRMAAELAEFLGVPIQVEYPDEPGQPAARDQQAGAAAPDQQAAGIQLGQAAASYSKRLTPLVLLARVCYLAAFAAAFFFVVMWLQQARLDELESTVRPVRARLIATEVKEWIEGHDNWAPFGTFQIEPGDYQGRAEGDLIPESFYAAHVQRRRHIKIPRAKAETFLADWQIGQEYDGYIHSDAKQHIFFNRPGAEENARFARRLGITSAVFLTLGIMVSRCVAYLTRRPPPEPTRKVAPSAIETKGARPRRRQRPSQDP